MLSFSVDPSHHLLVKRDTSSSVDRTDKCDVAAYQAFEESMVRCFSGASAVVDEVIKNLIWETLDR